MPKIQISKYGTQSVKVADILGNDDAMHQIEEIAEARLAEQSEITALREKLAAAHAALQLPENADLVENIKLLKLGALKQYEKAMNNNARCQWEYRAAARDALAELRATVSFEAVSVEYPPDLVGEYLEKKQVLSEIDATIAKLDLPEATAPCTWTPDDDGNYATGCDGLFVILEGSPAENKMAYCCYCGKPIKEQPK